MSAHTPGPWRKADGYGAIVADGPTGCDDDDNVRAYGGHLVAESVDPRNRPIIIAAPDLYDACKAALSAYDGADVHSVSDHAAARLLRAAIAKAEGRS